MYIPINIIKCSQSRVLFDVQLEKYMDHIGIHTLTLRNYIRIIIVRLRT